MQPGVYWSTLLAEGRTVLFIYVNWSGYSTKGRSIVEQAETRWSNEYPNQPVSWWAVDASVGVSELAGLSDWLAFQDEVIRPSAEQLTGGGWGPLIWIEPGRAVGFASAAFKLSVDELVELTWQTFGMRRAEDLLP